MPKNHLQVLEDWKALGHEPILDEDGGVDIFAYNVGIHNGPKCRNCGDTYCRHCAQRGLDPARTRCGGNTPAHRFARSVCEMFESDKHWSVLDLDGAREFFDSIGYTPPKDAMEVE